MNNILHVEANGDWLVERPHATGSDFGPGHYGKKPHGCDADTQVAFYKRAGYDIDDKRIAA